ncbi:hypothetical protein HPB48_005237 [Haemaphysalis longicornis]|uniref:Tick transposon n=1 Tax=Haemaphysalis longicornis TaxID=44386 RepID=A0A9J6FHL7_HAELO|nr:hypothetical protein HPB48_005237 [Haemaphysalis longicornis]
MNQQAQISTLLKFISSSTGPFQCAPSDPSMTVTLIAVVICRARTISFCIRKRILPEDVRSLFGGFLPSAGHIASVCKIMSAEFHRQARLYRQLLAAQLLNFGCPSGASRRFREYHLLAARTTEFIWTLQLTYLRNSVKVKPQTAKQQIHALEPLDLPPDVIRVLSLGPKFAVQPKSSPPELLPFVPDISRNAPISEQERCIYEGVDVLSRTRPAPSSLAIKRIRTFLEERGLAVLPADQEGGFCYFIIQAL